MSKIDKFLHQAGAYFGGDGVNYDQFDPRKFAALVRADERELVLAAAIEEALAQPVQEHDAAIKTLEHLKYTYHGGEYWKPPLGPAPAWAQPPLPVQPEQPEQRRWVGLTDEEILADGVLGYHFGKNGGAGPLTATGKAIIEVVTDMLKERNS